MSHAASLSFEKAAFVRENDISSLAGELRQEAYPILHVRRLHHGFVELCSGDYLAYRIAMEF